MADEKTKVVSASDETEVHPLVGLPDGHVDAQGEKIVYELDADGKFAGWHKEA